MNFDTPPQALTICGEWNKIFEDTRHKRQAAPDCLFARAYPARPGEQPAVQEMYPQKVKAIPYNSRLTAQAPLRRLRNGICVAKMLDNVGLRYLHRASGGKSPSHSATAAPASVRCFRHWRRSPLQHPVLSALLA